MRDCVDRVYATIRNEHLMDVSKNAQRALHVLAQGGVTCHFRDGRRVVRADCVTRERYLLAGLSLQTFENLASQVHRLSWRPAMSDYVDGFGAVLFQTDNRRGW